MSSIYEDKMIRPISMHLTKIVESSLLETNLKEKITTENILNQARGATV